MKMTKFTKESNVWQSGRCPTRRPDAIHFFVNFDVFKIIQLYFNVVRKILDDKPLLCHTLNETGSSNVMHNFNTVGITIYLIITDETSCTFFKFTTK